MNRSDNEASPAVESICEDLVELGLERMANDLAAASRLPDFFTRSPLDVIREMIAGEFEDTISKRLNSRLRTAHLLGCTASLSSCQDTNARQYLPLGIMDALSSMKFIPEAHNVCILGPSASGKTYLAKALAVHACRHWRAEYYHTEEFLQTLSDLHENNVPKYRKALRRLARLPLLILDDFLLHPVQSDWEASCLFSILDRRIEEHHATVVCSQRAPEGWKAMLLNDTAIADSITTRVTRDYTVCIDLRTENNPTD